MKRLRINSSTFCSQPSYDVPYKQIIALEAEDRRGAIEPLLIIAIPYPQHVGETVAIELLKQLDNLVADTGQYLVTHYNLAISRFLGV